jgi:LCP family protein required for cell wall assembly
VAKSSTATPPAASAPSTKRPSAEAPRKSAGGRPPLWARASVMIGAVLLVLTGTAVFGVQAAISKLESNINVVDGLGDGGTRQHGVNGAALDGPINLLLLGVDVRPDWDRNETRADTILLLHVSKSHDQAYLMSIPRDSLVRIPANPATDFRGGQDRVNSAFLHGAMNGGGWQGGLSLQARTVSDLTGIDFNGAAVIDFGGFSNVIDTLGSVRMCIEADTESLHYYYVGGKPTYVNEHEAADRRLKPYVHLQGCRDMPGWEALDYSRIRKSLDDGDYGRQRHQQQLIKAMATKAGDVGMLTDLGKVERLLSAVGKSMMLDTDGVPLIDFLFSMKELSGADLVLLKANAGEFNSTSSMSELLSEETMEMFAAAREDRMSQFVFDHPHLVNNS